jgi:ketosteroid isomerase-like protein
MSEQVEVVQRAFAAFGRRDIPALLECTTDDIVWEPIYGAEPHVPQAGRRQGKTQVADFFAVLDRSTGFLSFEPLEFVEQGRTVIVLGRYHCRVNATGRELASDWVMIFRFRDGRIAAFREFTNSAALNEAYLQSATAS